MSTATRKTLAGTGEHIAAVLQLGDNYTQGEYIEAITAAREAGIGEAYAEKVLGVDADSVLRGVEHDDGESILRAAEADLHSHGIAPRRATYAEMLDALVRVAP